MVDHTKDPHIDGEAQREATSQPAKLGKRLGLPAAVAAAVLAACAPTKDPQYMGSAHKSRIGVVSEALQTPSPQPVAFPDSINKFGGIDGAGGAKANVVKDFNNGEIQGKVNLLFSGTDKSGFGNLVRAQLNVSDDGNNGVILGVEGTPTIADPKLGGGGEEFAMLEMRGFGGGVNRKIISNTEIIDNGITRFSNNVGVGTISSGDTSTTIKATTSIPGYDNGRAHPVILDTTKPDWEADLKARAATALAQNNGMSGHDKLVTAGVLDPASKVGVNEGSFSQSQSGNFKVITSGNGITMFTKVNGADTPLRYDVNAKVWVPDANSPTLMTGPASFGNAVVETTTKQGRKGFLVIFEQPNGKNTQNLYAKFLVPGQAMVGGKMADVLFDVPVAMQDVAASDMDGDGTPDQADNCPPIANSQVLVPGVAGTDPLGVDPSCAADNIQNGVGDSLVKGFDKVVVNGGDSLVHYVDAQGKPVIDGGRVVDGAEGEKVLIAHGSKDGKNPSRPFTVTIPNGDSANVYAYDTSKLDGTPGKVTVDYRVYSEMPGAQMKTEVLSGTNQSFQTPVTWGATVGSEGTVMKVEVGSEGKGVVWGDMTPPPADMFGMGGGMDGGVTDGMQDMGGVDMTPNGSEDGGASPEDMAQNPDLANNPDMSRNTPPADLGGNADMARRPHSRPDLTDEERDTDPESIRIRKLTGEASPLSGQAGGCEIAPTPGAEKNLGALGMVGLAVAGLRRRFFGRGKKK